MKTIMNILVIVSAIVMTVTLVMINCFGLYSLHNTMSAATMLFIASMCYMLGHTDGRKEVEDSQRIEVG